MINDIQIQQKYMQQFPLILIYEFNAPYHYNSQQNKQQNYKETKQMKNKTIKRPGTNKFQLIPTQKSQQYTHSTLVTIPNNAGQFNNQFIDIDTQQNKSYITKSVSPQKFNSQKSLQKIGPHQFDAGYAIDNFKNSRVYRAVSQINQYVASQITQGVTVIPDHSEQVEQLFLQYLPKEQLQNILKRREQSKMKQLLKMKQDALQKLDKVYQEQAKIRINRKYKMHSALGDHSRLVTQAGHNRLTNISNEKRQRSYFSPQQKTKIKQILKIKDQKPLIIEKKVQQLMNSLNVQKQKQRIEQKLKIQRLKQEHRKQVEEHLRKKQFEKKQKQLMRQKYQSNSCKLRLQDYAHIKHQKTDLMREKQKIKVQQIILFKQRDEKKFDIEQIKQHQKKYADIMKEKKAQLQEKARSRISTIQQQRKFYSITKIKKILAEQESQNKQKGQETMQLKVEYHQKLKQYDAYIKQNYQPKSSEKSKFQPKRRISVSVLSQQQRIRQGKRYLQYAKLTKKNSQMPHSQSEIDNDSNNSIGKLTQYEQKKANRQKYPNYLDFVKELNQKQNPNNGEQQQKELMRILKSQNSSLMEIKKAVNLAGKLASKPSHENSSRKGSLRMKTESDYENAKTKLRLLNGIMNVDKKD